MEYPGKVKIVSTYKPRKHPYRVSKVLRREIHRTYDRIYATIYGQCVGDAIGLLTEGLRKDEIKKHYKEVYDKLEMVHKKCFPDAHRRKWQQGDWTDETDQMVLILQSIVQKKSVVDPVDYAKRLMCWSEQGLPELGDEGSPGVCSHVKNVVSHPQFSEEPLRASEIVWRDSGRFVASNSAVARTAILGVHQHDTLGQVIKNTLDICRVTHYDPRCEASCVAVTTTIALMLQKNERHIKRSGKYDIESVIDEAYMFSSRLLKNDKDMKELKAYLYCTSLKDLHLDEAGRSNYTYKALGAGFWALKQKDFRQAIQDIVHEGGDADANAAVAGALLGCKLGLDAIPKSWMEPLKHRVWLDELIDRYFDMIERKKRQKETVV
ncbi:ADP-ribosylarginine hydrolase Tri1-like [Mercenaria mercenaria]|uniref:ADP-ribosylarginine hydrolase Tri1-like n=1 Tax=Mercenaria mercenaria TaxID=6596 RepID=UPI00234EB014|nr:ADP-ribosylarginine hydrolase Tri1-like [Mercenaria mercenaria]